MRLKLKSVDAEKGKIEVTLAGDSDSEHKLELSIFEVSTLVSMLYSARKDALQQPIDDFPDVALNIHKLQFGDDENHIILRLYISEELYHDYGALKSSPLGEFLAELAQVMANPDEPVPPGPAGWEN